MVKKTQKVANRILFFTRNFPRRNLLFIGGIFTLLAILSVVPEDEPDRTKLVTEPILVPIEFEPLEIVNNQIDLHWRLEEVGKGDNLSTLFLRACDCALVLAVESKSRPSSVMSNANIIR